VLGEGIGLQAQDVGALGLGQRRRGGVEVVDVLEADDLDPAGRLVGRGALAAVHVEGAVGRQHRVVALRGGGDRPLDAAPGHHRGVGGEAAFEDLVPADHPAAAAVDVLLDPLDEPALQAVLVLDAQGLDLGLDLGAGLPLVLDRLVAADVDVLDGNRSITSSRMSLRKAKVSSLGL
jgi:hypothetical protein